MQDLIIASKTENWTTIYTIIRNFFKIDGLKPYLIPAPRSLQRNGQDYARLFLKLFKPQHTFSGFRIDLVLAVKFAVFCLLNRTNISGVSVDIWGDGAEIGKKDHQYGVPHFGRGDRSIGTISEVSKSISF